MESNTSAVSEETQTVDLACSPPKDAKVEVSPDASEIVRKNSTDVYLDYDPNERCCFLCWMNIISTLYMSCAVNCVSFMIMIAFFDVNQDKTGALVFLLLFHGFAFIFGFNIAYYEKLSMFGSMAILYVIMALDCLLGLIYNVVVDDLSVKLITYYSLWIVLSLGFTTVWIKAKRWFQDEKKWRRGLPKLGKLKAAKCYALETNFGEDASAAV